MPFFLIVAGLMLTIAGARNTQGDLLTLVKKDFTGVGNFVYWFVSILLIGAIGYVKALKPIANGFLVLVILMLFLAPGNRGFFSQFQAAIGTLQSAATAPIGGAYDPGVITDVTPAPAPAAAKSSGIGGIFSSLVGVASLFL